MQEKQTDKRQTHHDLSRPVHNSYDYAEESNDNLWMDNYFDDEVFKIKIHPKSQISQFEVQNIKDYISLPQRQLQPQSSSYSVKNKSPFHNFPKHLITLIKKIFKIQRKQLLDLPLGPLALKLYRIFISVKKYAKKYLYIIFGVTQHENIDVLTLLSYQIPALNKLIINVGISEIQQAQALLRSIASKQFDEIKKQQLIPICKVAKFDQFYKYYVNFVKGLSLNGGTCIRLRKNIKNQLTKESIKIAQRPVQNQLPQP